MVRLRQKILAGTLVETIVSMTLIIIIIGCTFTALISISGSTLNRAKVCASHVINARLKDDYYVSSPKTTDYDYEGFIIIEEFIPRDEDRQLKTIKIEAITPGGRVIYRARRIVISYLP
jgi:type II secretory pathway pseudopilin PulG